MFKKLFIFIASVSLLLSCGEPEKTDLDLVGGVKVYRHWYSAMEVGGGFRCGGSLIHEKVVMTAKHCIIQNRIHETSVRVGAYNRFHPMNEDLPFDLIRVKSVIEHPNVDLALLILERSSTVLPPVNFANLNIQNGEAVHAFGMGNVAFNVDGGGILRGAELVHRLIAGQDPNLIHTDGGMGKGVCFGDSGGPLYHPASNTVIGVASWTGTSCARQYGVDGWARPQIPWIQENIKKYAGSSIK